MITDPIVLSESSGRRNASFGRSSAHRRLGARHSAACWPTLLCSVVTCGVGFQLWHTASLGGFDLGIFDQGIRSYAHFELPHSAIKNVHHEFPPTFSLLGDHFSPILALLAPLYWVWDDPRVLMVAQAALFATGVPVVRRISLRCFAHARPAVRARAALVTTLSYAVGWPLLVAARNGFHEVAFAVPLTLFLLERGLARRYGAVAACAVLLCLTKEDLGVVVGAYGAVLLWRSRRGGRSRARLTGAALLVLGPAMTAVTIGVLIPAMGGLRHYYWSYGALGDSFGALMRRAVTDPSAYFTVAFGTPVKAGLVLWLLSSLLLLPLGAATTLCAVPLVAERILSDNPNHWSLIHHYDAFTWPILLTAAVETAARLHRAAQRKGAGPRRSAAVGGVLVVGIGLASASFFGLITLFSPDHWKPSADARNLIEAAERVPDGATVEADNNVAVRLTARTRTVILDAFPRGADYVVLQTAKATFPFTTTAQLEQRRSVLLAHGYRCIWAHGETVLLRRTSGKAIVPGTRIPGPDSTPVKDVPDAGLGRNLFTG
ncbi:DUF2079 domain-containing protein [Streptomyces sp. NPDC018045]|uniref:DUF2079 domain-containing protein n=1 Tax=Streptomyces sp. NPDC018045 TaxID=3365037 RepID=UPI0037980BB2